MGLLGTDPEESAAGGSVVFKGTEISSATMFNIAVGIDLADRPGTCPSIS